MIFRARYERKKAKTQGERYKEALEEAEQKETSKLTLDEIEAKIINYFDIFYNVDKNDIDVDLLAMVAKRNLGIRLGHNKVYRLKKQIIFEYWDFNYPGCNPYFLCFGVGRESNRRKYET